MSRDRKKILFLIPTLFHGGGERVVSELSLHLSTRLDTVIALFDEKISYPFGGRIVSLRTPLSPNLFLGAYLFAVRLLRLHSLLKEEQPDFVVSLGASANILSLLAAKNPIVRVDMFISEGRKGFHGTIFRMLVRLLFPRAGRIVAVSQDIAQDLVSTFRLPAEKIRVIHNPVDIEKISRLSREPIAQEYEQLFQHPVVIAMGRLKEQKGHRYLLSAFALAKKEVPEAKLVILGEGPLRSSLERQATTLGIAEDVHFLGWQENPFSFLKKSRVFVLSSLWEGLPDVLLEAMACELPIVSTDCKSGPREILGSLYGVLVPVKNEPLLAQAIVRVLRDPAFAQSIALKAKERAEDFRIEALLEEWYTIFQ